jgi:thiol-disulfide isomerase/thioredoxin
MLRINFVFFFIFISILSYSQGINFFEGSFNDAKELAIKQNKIIFIDCYTSWCGPCKWMAKNVFPDKNVGAFYNQNFINYKMDMEKGVGKDVKKVYKISGYPTLLFINGEGEEEHRSLGGCDTAEFIRIGRKTLDRENNFGSLLRKYNSGDRSPEFLAKYALECVNLSIGYDINEYFKTQNDTDLFKEINLTLIECYLTDINSREFKFFATNYEKYIQLYGNQRIESRLVVIFSKSLWSLTNQKDPKPVPVVINERVGLYQFKDSSKIALKIEMQFYCNSKWRDWNYYSVLADKLIDKFGIDSIQNYELEAIIQNVGKNCTNIEILNKSLIWCDFFINKNYLVSENMLNKARIYMKIGKLDSAKEYANKALVEEQNKTTPQIKEIQKFIKELEQPNEKN